MKPVPIPVGTAKEIAQQYGYHQVMIFARHVSETDGVEHMTTYGVNSEHCNTMAQIGDFLKTKVMGWIKSKDQTPELEMALNELEQATDFYDQVKKSSEDTSSNGAFQDAWKWLNEAAFKVSVAWKKESK